MVRTKLKMLGLLVVVGAWGWVSAASAADITEVIDAFDEVLIEGKMVSDPFDLVIKPTFKQVYEHAKISREANCLAGGGRCDEDTIVINKEMRYRRVINQMDLDFEIGAYKDLALSMKLPIVFSDVSSWKFAKNGGAACRWENPDNPKCVNETNSSLFPSQDRIESDLLDPTSPFSTFSYFPLADGWTDGPSRSGVGDITFGIAWSPFNDVRSYNPEQPWLNDSGRSTLTLGLDYTAPTAEVAKVTNDAVGRGVHELALRVATSRRFTYVDPYAQFQFGLPLPASDTLFKDYGGGQQRVGPGPWGDITVGIEFIPWESVTKEFQQFFKIDLRGRFGYVGEGRDYGPFFDAIGASACQGLTWSDVQSGGPRPECGWIAEKWSNAGFENLVEVDPHGAQRNPNVALYDDGITNHEGFGRFAAQIGFYLQPVQYVQLRLMAALEHEQGHFMTFSKAGKDVRGRTPDTDVPSEFEPKDGTVSFDDVKERNPTYNPTYDSVGNRFRKEETTIFTWAISLAVQF